MGLFWGKSFSAATDIPDLEGKIIFITGGNVGLGKATSLALAKHNPGHIYLSARSPEKAATAIEEIKAVQSNVPISFIECDLASLESVEKAAKEFNSKSQRLDILLCNAGVMALPPGLTKDGYEIQFGTNHVGHALLIKLLLPTLVKTAEQPNSDVRIVVLSSMGHKWTPTGGIAFKDLNTNMHSSDTWARYGQSKLANILYVKELARRYPNIKSIAVHPGAVHTNLSNTFVQSNILFKALGLFRATFLATVETGMLNQLWAATGPNNDVVSGEYYEPIASVGGGSRNSNNEKLAGDLWDWTQKELENYNA